MKRTLSILSFVFLIGIVSANAQCSKTCKETKPCCAGSASVENSEIVPASSSSTQASAVEAYYFHATRRCATCQAVESVTKEALKEFYGDNVNFKSINREEESDNPMIDKYKISGQTLLIIKGDKVVNLTNYAFMNARTNPDKFKEKIKSTIDSLI